MLVGTTWRTNVGKVTDGICFERVTYVGHSIFDELLVTTDDEEPFVFIVVTLITRVDPSVDDCLCRFLISN